MNSLSYLDAVSYLREHPDKHDGNTVNDAGTPRQKHSTKTLGFYGNFGGSSAYRVSRTQEQIKGRGSSVLCLTSL